MNQIKNIIIAVMAISFFTGCRASGQMTAEKDDWKLSIQSWTFHLFTVTESLEKTKQLGIKYIEIYPGQPLGGDFGKALFDYNLTAAARKQLKELAASYGIKIVSMGVLVPKREEWEKYFAFSKEMGLEFITAEPAHEDWDLVEGLAKKYGIKVSVHNHPAESSYWKPEILLKDIRDRSNLLGACADVGHYKRMGLDPTDCLKQLRGKVISLHFKDIIAIDSGKKFEDIVWGDGVLNVSGILKELHLQKFKGYFTIEYEAKWENNLPEIKKSIDYFHSERKKIRNMY